MTEQEVIPRVGDMYDPPHPGEVLKELHIKPLKLKIQEVADRLGVERKAVSRLVNARTAVTPDMAMRIAKAFNTTPKLWLDMQCGYDLWHAKQRMKRELRQITPFSQEEYRPEA